jgi:hypothetical protein
MLRKERIVMCRSFHCILCAAAAARRSTAAGAALAGGSDKFSTGISLRASGSAARRAALQMVGDSYAGCHGAACCARGRPGGCHVTFGHQHHSLTLLTQEARPPGRLRVAAAHCLRRSCSAFGWRRWLHRRAAVLETARDAHSQHCAYTQSSACCARPARNAAADAMHTRSGVTRRHTRRRRAWSAPVLSAPERAAAPRCFSAPHLLCPS